MTQGRRNPGTSARATSTTPIADTDHTAETDIKPGKSLVWIPCTRPPAPQDINSQLERRRAAAQRSIPLDCSCRDLWPCRCTQPPLSEHALDGWRDAAQHVLATGRVPLVPLEVRRALWKRPADRALAELLHEACDEVAS